MSSHRTGVWGERLAVLLLRLKGWSILERGFTVGRGSGAGEVDIIARRGGVIAFVEVKARADMEKAAFAITPRQQGRIARAAQAWASRNPQACGCSLRFDAVLVAPFRLPRHISDAWRMDA